MKVLAEINVTDKKYTVNLSLVKFKEDKTTIIYSPALDLSGYGDTASEAQSSFTTTLHEFVKYTHNKSTIQTVLKSMGWKIKESKTAFTCIPPKETDLIKKNSLYTEILNKKEFSVVRENIELAF